MSPRQGRDDTLPKSTAHDRLKKPPGEKLHEKHHDRRRQTARGADSKALASADRALRGATALETSRTTAITWPDFAARIEGCFELIDDDLGDFALVVLDLHRYDPIPVLFERIRNPDLDIGAAFAWAAGMKDGYRKQGLQG